MPILTLDIAAKIIESHNLACARLKNDQQGHRKYGLRYLFQTPVRRDINVATRPTNEGLTCYINMTSAGGETFPVVSPEMYFSGVMFKHHYPKGSRGFTGDKGLSSVAGSCPTLDPYDYDVLRLSCSDVKGFERLIRWYTGDESLGLNSPASSVEENHVLVNTGKTDGETVTAGVSDNVKDSDPASGLFEAEISTAEVQLTSDEISSTEEAGIMSDPERRLVVEQYAVKLASEHYGRLGYNIVELGKPYDLLCEPKPDTVSELPIVHVEVKGSVGQARTILLTKNEVLHARDSDGWRTDLVIVSCIDLERKAAGGWVASGGQLRCIEEWLPADSDLVPTQFEYQVP